MLKKMIYGLSVVLFALISCDSDNSNPSLPTENNVLITTNVTNSDGGSGTSYFQTVKAVEGSIDNSKAMVGGFGVAPIVIGKHIFVLPDYMGNTAAVLKHFVKDANGNITLAGTLQLPASAGAGSVVMANEQTAYVSMQNVGIVMEFNPTSMTKTRDYDLNYLAQKDVRVAPAAMVIRDSLLYVGLNQFNSQWMPIRKQAEICIINVKTNKVFKHIVDTKHELSFATRPIDPHSIFVNDKDGAIYLNCIGSFGFIPGFGGGILRIKQGETDFDPDYVLPLATTAVNGLNNNIDYLGTVRLASDGKVYSMAAIYALEPNFKNAYLAKVMVPVVIDLERRTITYIPGVEPSNGHAVAVGEYNGKIYFGSSNVKDNGFYAYNLTTQKLEGLVMRVQGFPAGLESLK